MTHIVDVILPKLSHESEFLDGYLQWDRMSTLI